MTQRPLGIFHRNLCQRCLGLRVVYGHLADSVPAQFLKPFNRPIEDFDVEVIPENALLPLGS